MAQFALIIAVEKYRDPSIGPVRFAEADASEFASVLQKHGFTIQELMLSQNATHAAMNSQIKRGVARLKKDDTFFIYYAGHGFSQGEKNFMTCHDTDPVDLVTTSLSLGSVFEYLESSPSEQIALFLDSCESGITRIDHRRGLYGQMSEAQIETFFKGSQFKVCFSACKTTESSYSDSTLKHGIWTHHILRALRGEVPRILEKNRYLTAHNLQNYLSQEVPLTLRQSRSDAVVQTPWLYGAQSRDFKIADLLPLMQQRVPTHLSEKQVSRVLLRLVENVDIKRLAGFKRGSHRVPNSINSSTQSFVERIASSEIDERVQDVFKAILAGFSYRRPQVKCVAGKIITPDFEYTASCAQHDSEPSQALIVEEIKNIKLTIITDDRFNNVFERHFNEVVLGLDTDISVEEIIDAIQDSGKFEVDYPPDASWCSIELSPTHTIRITDNELIVETLGRQSPKELLEGLHDVQKAFAGTAMLKLLSDGS